MCVYLYCKLNIDQTSYSERNPECVREGLKGCEVCRHNTSRAAFPEYQTHSIHLLQSTRCCSSTTTYTQAAKDGEVDCSNWTWGVAEECKVSKHPQRINSSKADQSEIYIDVTRPVWNYHPNCFLCQIYSEKNVPEHLISRVSFPV